MGRTLDYEFSYGDQITVTPRNYPFSFLHMPSLSHHYAMIGMACVMDDYPLYYEAFNEKGLGIAGLNFVGNAVYFDPKPEKDNIAQFELIPWILGTCASLAEAKESLSRINLISTPFKKNLPLAQLHWIIYHAIYNLLVSVGGTAQLLAYAIPLLTALCFRLLGQQTAAQRQ